MNNRLTNKFIAIALLAVSTVAFSASAKANNTDSTLKVNTPIEVTPVALQFIGSLDEQPVFRVNLNNNIEYTIVVKGNYGEVLYKDVISSNINSKKFMLTRDAFFDAHARFEITANDTGKKMIFDVDLNSMDADKMIVSSAK